MEHLFSTKSLLTLCINQSAICLEYYTPEVLSHVPPALRHQIFLHYPIVDICRFEKTSAFNSIKADKLWGEIYDKHWGSYDRWKYDNTVTTGSMDLIGDCATTNHEKYFLLLTTIIFNGEHPTGYFGRMSDNQKRIDNTPVGIVNTYPTDIINFLIAAHISTVVQV